MSASHNRNTTRQRPTPKLTLANTIEARVRVALRLPGVSLPNLCELTQAELDAIATALETRT